MLSVKYAVLNRSIGNVLENSLEILIFWFGEVIVEKSRKTSVTRAPMIPGGNKSGKTGETYRSLELR